MMLMSEAMAIAKGGKTVPATWLTELGMAKEAAAKASSAAAVDTAMTNLLRKRGWL